MANCRQGDVVCKALNYIKNLKFCTYCRKKSYAQISMDIALIMVNVAHLTQIIKAGPSESLYVIKLCLVGLSIFLEVSIGILLGVKERYDINDERHQRFMSFMNDFVVWLIFLSVLIHVFVQVFVEDPHVPEHYAHYLAHRNCSAMKM